MPNRQPYTLDRTVRLVINCVLFAAVLCLINVLRGVLLPFLVGCLVAYILEPFVQFNRDLLRLRGRVIATLVTLFELAFFLTVLGYFFIPMIIHEAAQMASMVKAYASTEFTIPFIPEGLHAFLRRHLDFNYLASMLSHDEWSRMIEETISASWSLITGSISLLMSVFSWAIVLLYIVFIMIDYERISRGFRHMVIPRYRPLVFRVARDVKLSMNRYFRGQALVALCVGILFSIGFLIIGLPLAVLMGLFIGLLNMVPYLQLISLVPVTLICIFSAVDGDISFWTMFWETMAVYVIVQAIQDLILTPRIIGKAMSMNPAIILFSLSVWGTLLGMIGLIIAIPLTTLLLSYYDQYLLRPDSESPHRKGKSDAA